METRNIEQVKVWGLILNTFGSAESGRLVALASSEQAIKDFYLSQRMEKMEKIDGWNYSFKEGPLRNYNPSGTQFAFDDVFGHGIFSEWVNTDSIREDVYRVDF